jgi:hypothetical protein
MFVGNLTFTLPFLTNLYVFQNFLTAMFPEICHNLISRRLDFLFQGNLILCKRDYLRLFGSTGFCSACNKVGGLLNDL